MRRTKQKKKQEKQQEKKKKKNKKQKKRKDHKKHVMLSKKRTPQFEELGTVPPIGPLAHQLWFFGVKKRAN